MWMRIGAGLFAAMFFYRVWRALKTGEIIENGDPTRAERPGQYWFVVGMFLTIRLASAVRAAGLWGNA